MSNSRQIQLPNQGDSGDENSHSDVVNTAQLGLGDSVSSLLHEADEEVAARIAGLQLLEQQRRQNSLQEEDEKGQDFQAQQDENVLDESEQEEERLDSLLHPPAPSQSPSIHGLVLDSEPSSPLPQADPGQSWVARVHGDFEPRGVGFVRVRASSATHASAQRHVRQAIGEEDVSPHSI